MRVVRWQQKMLQPFGSGCIIYDQRVLWKKLLARSQRVSRQREFHFYQKANWLSKCWSTALDLSPLTLWFQGGCCFHKTHGSWIRSQRVNKLLLLKPLLLSNVLTTTTCLWSTTFYDFSLPVAKYRLFFVDPCGWLSFSLPPCWYKRTHSIIRDLAAGSGIREFLCIFHTMPEENQPDPS